MGLKKKAFGSYIWVRKAIHLQIFKKIICEPVCVSQCKHICQKQKNNFSLTIYCKLLSWKKIYFETSQSVGLTCDKFNYASIFCKLLIFFTHFYWCNFFNHGAANFSNCNIKNTDVSGTPRLCFYASKLILKGTELRYVWENNSLHVLFFNKVALKCNRFNRRLVRVLTY